MLSIRKSDYLIDVYNSISEIYNDLKDKKPRPHAKNESDNRYEAGWAGSNSLEDAYNLMLHGDSKLYKKIKDAVKKIDITKILGNVIKRNTNYNDVVGFQVNVPNYLAGVPIDMINNHPTKKSQKIINIIVNTSVSAGIDSDDIIKAGAYYYTIIDLLEKAGYRCNVYVMASYRHDDEGYMVVRAKTDREPFNREKMAFLLAHPSFHRRVNFKWIECCPCKGEPTRSGYGTPITSEEHIKDVFDKELKSDFVVWSMQKDYKVSIGDLINRLKEKGIKIGDE